MDKMTVPILKGMKGKEKIAMLTAYDYPVAKVLDGAGVHTILVGDSVGTVILGYPNTMPVTVEDMIHHTKAVARAVRNAFVIIDMPFMSYQESIEQAKRNAGRMIKESGAEAVKLEGGSNMKETIRAIVDIDIPVVGHIGLTPQSIHRMGGHKVQGKGDTAAKLLEDARSVEEAGAFMVVIEGVPRGLAKQITDALSIPTIGIGAGPDCDGQVLVINDLVGLAGELRPKFVKTYLNLQQEIEQAVKTFVDEVKTGTFPDDAHSYH
ncbi:MAG TPA: 3-methyl-2-oxobutanoate hydroxymethyltransferase [Syntrophorhabdaceae bacterium]|nr:3-methyl-2-oxobutanoate hydroxymethyltransferase [Syntrophorhabdaceae bacterium]